MTDARGSREYFGALEEQVVALELSKQRAWTQTAYALYRYRELNGFETDLLLETWDKRLIAIEVTATQTPMRKHWENLIKLHDRFPDRDGTGVLLHAGNSTATLHGCRSPRCGCTASVGSLLRELAPADHRDDHHGDHDDAGQDDHQWAHGAIVTGP
ncbi:MAG: DUF4143 domain-containing protein [Propionibacteriaceae bacterium]|nr:DUF4143 domain-containing protein [Propionibacteriaceae bacterium]